MAAKRKRDDGDDGKRSGKIFRGQLSKQYARRERDISEVLMNGANLNVGHISGTLDAVNRNGNILSFCIKDNADKILICEFATATIKANINRGIGKPFKIAISSPFRFPNEGASRYEYGYKLVFDHYQFLLGGDLHEETKGKITPGYLNESDSEQEPEDRAPNKQPEQSAKAPVTTAPLLSRAPSAPYIAHSTSRAEKPTWKPLFEVLKHQPAGDITIAGIVKQVNSAPRLIPGNSNYPPNWGMELHLIDQSCTRDQFLEVKLYAPKLAHLPPIDANDSGVAVILSGLRVHQSKDKKYVFARWKAPFAKYVCYTHGQDEPNVRDLRGEDTETYTTAPVYQWKPAELMELKRMMAWYFREPIPPALYEQEGQERSGPKYKGTYKLIEEVHIGDYFDCIVEVLSKFSDQRECIVWVTDYTVNKLLPERAKNPSGHRSLRIQLYDDPADQVLGLEAGFFYKFQNVRLNKGDSGFIQGVCGNFKNNQRNEIRLLESSHEAVMKLKERKRAYEHGGLHIYAAKAQRSKAKSPEATKTADTAEDQSSRTQESVLKARAASPPPPPSNSFETAKASKPAADPPKVVSPLSLDPKPKIKKTYPLFPDFIAIEPSNLIQCRRSDKYALSTLEDIEFCPVNPALFKFQGRIVDIEPDNLENAIFRVCTTCKEICEKERCDNCRPEETVEYRPRFRITFQDATGEFPVNFGDDAAVKFFRLSKKACHNKEILLQELSQRFQVLMGPTMGNKYQVGGVSEIFELVVRSWQIKAGPVRPYGPGSTRWIKCLAPAGCWMANKQV